MSLTHAALSRRPRRPVDHDGEWRGAALLQLADEEKTLAVGCRRIVGVVHLHLREIEQRLWQTCLERAAALHVHCHQLPVSGAIEQFFSVAPPLRMVATFGRDLPPIARYRKSLHVDFRPS